MINTNAQGFYSWAVLNKDGKVVRFSERPEPNMIVAQGLDAVAIYPWADCFRYCCLGSGAARPKANQVELENELARTGLVLASEFANTAEIIDGKYVLRRTFTFPTESTQVTYREAGLSWSPTPGANIFARMAINNLVVEADERLIFQYELILQFSPTVGTDLSNPIEGIESSGSFSYQLVGLKGVSADGSTENFDLGEGCNEPSITGYGFISSDDSSLSEFGTSTERSGKSFSFISSSSPYTSGDNMIEKKILMRPKMKFNTMLRSLGIGGSIEPESNSGLAYVLNEPFRLKANTVIVLAFKYTWKYLDTSLDRFNTLAYWQNEEQWMRRRINPILDYLDYESR